MHLGVFHVVPVMTLFESGIHSDMRMAITDLVASVVRLLEEVEALPCSTIHVHMCVMGMLASITPDEDTRRIVLHIAVGSIREAGEALDTHIEHDAVEGEDHHLTDASCSAKAHRDVGTV